AGSKLAVRQDGATDGSFPAESCRLGRAVGGAEPDAGRPRRSPANCRARPPCGCTWRTATADECRVSNVESQRGTQTRPRPHRAPRLLAPQTRSRGSRKSCQVLVNVSVRGVVPASWTAPVLWRFGTWSGTHAARKRRRTAALQDA